MTTRMPNFTASSPGLCQTFTRIRIARSFSKIAIQKKGADAFRGSQAVCSIVPTEGVTIEFLESQAATDFRPNIDSFISKGCDVIITVGFLLEAVAQGRLREGARVLVNLSGRGDKDMATVAAREGLQI